MHREEENDKRSGISPYMKTALVATGAAFLYRSHISRVAMSKGFSRATSFLRRVRDDIQETPLYKRDGLEDIYHNLIRKKDSPWHMAQKETEKITLRYENPNNLFNVLRDAYAVKNSKMATSLGRQFDTNFIVNPLVNHYTQGLDNILAKKIHSYAQKAVSIYEDNSALKILEDKLFSEQHRKQFDLHKFKAAMADAIKKNKDQRFAYIQKNGTALQEKILAKLLDPKSLARRFSKKVSDENMLTSVLTPDMDYVTVKDLIENKDKFKPVVFSKIDKDGRHNQDGIEYLKEHYNALMQKDAKKAEQFAQLTIDPSLRKSKGEIYSFTAKEDLQEKTFDFLAGTLPGKILKLRGFLNKNKISNFNVFSAGSIDPIIKAKLSTGSENPVLNETLYGINGFTYRFIDDQLVKTKEAANTYLVSGNTGPHQRILNQILGNTNYQESDQAILHALDIGQSPDLRSGVLEKYADSHWRGNLFDHFLHQDQETIEQINDRNALRDHLDFSADGFLTEYHAKTREFNQAIRENISALDYPTAKKIFGGLEDTNAMDTASLLDHDGREILNALLTKDEEFINKDLNALLNEYINNPNQINQKLTLKADDSFHKTVNKADRFFDLLRLETQKEVFLKEAMANGSQKIMNLLDNADITEATRQKSKELAYYAIFQNNTLINAGTLGPEQLFESVRETSRFFTDDGSAIKKDIINTFDHMNKAIIDPLEKGSSVNPTIDGQYALNDVIHINKAVTPLDIITSLNNFTKLKATTKRFFKQFNAGRDNPEDITTATLVPYFFLSRLSDPLKEIGLGIPGLNFSRDSMENSGELLKSIFLKRVLPIGLSINALSYTNDLLQATTGTGFTNLTARGMANIDIGIRKGIDTFGLSGIIQAERDLNPISQYLFGTEYQDSEERKDWYQNGYEPVRKARFWSFGSINEFRGGKIDYWQPNYLRRIESDYRDKSLYGNFLNKWSHSLMPTPTNPLSPLLWALDARWLERQHYDDRPYPVSGPLFSPGTPWGVVLNPTLGEIIKPIKRLHQEDEAGSFMDSKNAIAYLNAEIKQRGNNVLHRNKISLGNDMTAIDTEEILGKDINLSSGQSISNGSSGSSVGASYGDGALSDRNEAMSGRQYVKYMSDRELIAIDTGLNKNLLYNFLDQSFKDPSAIFSSFQDTISIKKAQIVFGGKAMLAVSNMNETIKLDAAYKKLKEKDVLQTETLSSVRARDSMYLLDNEEAVSDLVNVSSGDDFIREAKESTKLIAGIYGYIGSQFNKKTNKHLAQASDMTSFGRTFWDWSIGGIGGEVGDIFRRFIPTFKRGERINPLRNRMPDWLPERFMHGDPFTKIPKGEMRLPGKGYESLNDLHSDHYGRYGSFDRFKILADIAPRSQEYKLWRKIASETTEDPILKQEIKDIRKRVTEQNKEHEFYNDKFIGKEVKYVDATVSEITGTNTFKIIGSDKTFKMAGISVKKNQDGTNPLEEVLFAGQSVQLGLDANPSYQVNRDVAESVNVSVITNGFSLNKELLESGKARRRKVDTSAPAYYGTTSGLGIAYGTIMEGIAHLDVPLLSNKFLKIRTPLDSYRAEHIYGTDFQSWAHPFKSFLYPAFYRSIDSGHKVLIAEAAKIAYDYAHNNNLVKSKFGRVGLSAAYMLADRGAFIGGFTAGLIKFSEGGKAVRAGAKIGHLAALAGYAYTRLDDPVQSAINFGAVGLSLAKYIEKQSSFHLNQVKDVKVLGKYAAIGAGVGVAASAVKNHFNPKSMMQNKTWIPEVTKKRWQIEEYFDRLNYLKYEGLYQRAALKAKIFEFTDIDKMYRLQEKENKRKEKVKKYLENKKKFFNTYMDSDSKVKNFMVKKINEQLESDKLNTAIVNVGKYGRAAMIYKEAAKSTVYGLNKHSSFAQIMRALPKEERAYFSEFVKESDPKKRQDILRTANPLLKRSLHLMWGNEIKPQSNMDYFKSHYLPSIMWSGWRPGVDLKDIKVKTIKNEGLLLSDFDHYESEADKPSVQLAPNMKHNQKSNDSSIALRLKLLSIMHGMGLKDVAIDVNPSTLLNTDIHIDILKTTSNSVKYGIKQKLHEAFETN